LYTLEGVLEGWGVSPSSFPDLLALMGDTADGYAGAVGIGRVSAVKLLQKHGPHISDLYANLALVEPRWREKLIQHRDSVMLSLQLAELRDAVPGVDLTKLGEAPKAVAE